VARADDKSRFVETLLSVEDTAQLDTFPVENVSSLVDVIEHDWSVTIDWAVRGSLTK
jgi:hypothetical protein